MLLSICIPTYNRDEVVYRCVKNCLDNIREDIEVIVSDNHSTDNTSSLLSSISDTRFRYYRNEKNIGYPNIVESIFYAQGEYALVLSDEDDLILEGLKELINSLKQYDNLAIVYGDYAGRNGELKSRYGATKLIEGKNVFNQLGIEWGGFCTGIVYNTSIVKKVKDDIDKSSSVWKLYPHRYIETLMYAKGDILILGKALVIEAREGKLDSFAWTMGKIRIEDNYMTIYSRIIQMDDWIKLHKKVCASDRLISCIPLYFAHLRGIFAGWFSLIKQGYHQEIFGDLYEKEIGRGRVWWLKFSVKSYFELIKKLQINWFEDKNIYGILIRNPQVLLKIDLEFLKLLKAVYAGYNF